MPENDKDGEISLYFHNLDGNEMVLAGPRHDFVELIMLCLRKAPEEEISANGWLTQLFKLGALNEYKVLRHSIGSLVSPEHLNMRDVQTVSDAVVVVFEWSREGTTTTCTVTTADGIEVKPTYLN